MHAENQLAQEANYKQVSKLKHLTDEHSHLKSLVNILQQINHRTRVILKGIQDKNKKSHLNSTACSIGLVTNQISLPQHDVSQIQQLVTSLHMEIECKKEQFIKKIQSQEKNKIEDQILFRKMLYEYESKLSSIKRQIQLRQQSIQKVQKINKDNKTPIVQQKILGVYYSSFELFEQMCFVKEQLKNTIQKTVSIEFQISLSKEQIKRLQEVLLKLRVAKQAKIPYHKFRSILKQGLYSIQYEDIKDYTALTSLCKQQQQLFRPMQSKATPNINITPQMLYLMIRKEQINKQLLQKLIRQQDLKQEELLANNQRLKQAVLLKESQEYFQSVSQTLINKNNYTKQRNQQRLSQTSRVKKKFNKKKTNLLYSSDYQIHLQALRKKVQETMNGRQQQLMTIKTMKKSKSQQCFIDLEQNQQQMNEAQKLMSQQDIFDQFNNMITQRFYEDEGQFEFVE